jgi:hypothetical protein
MSVIGLFRIGIKVWAAALLISVVFGCADSPTKAQTTTVHVDGLTLSVNQNGDFIMETPRCPFNYTPKLKAELLPLLQKNLRADIEFYDIDNPGAILYKDHVRLLFGATLTSSRGRTLVDADRFVIELDVCSLAVERSYFESPFK